MSIDPGTNPAAWETQAPAKGDHKIVHFDCIVIRIVVQFYEVRTPKEPPLVLPTPIYGCGASIVLR
jgi:hypothetical protein